MINNQKGMALIMVLSTIVLMILLIQETVFETQVEYRAATEELNSLRAYYAAKAGMEINILRVKNYIGINKKYGKQVETFRSYVDLIWKFPFNWPPLMPEDLDTTSAKEFADIKNNSLMQNAKFMTSIQPTTSKLDINDLASPIPTLRNWTRDRFIRLLMILEEKEPELFSEIGSLNITEKAIELSFNIVDWLDPDQTNSNNPSQSESNFYELEGLPPNRPFVSLDELKQVAGMTDSIYKSLEPFITIYGEKGLNINTAPVELLQALDPDFFLELAEEARNLVSNPAQPFLFTEESFKDFLKERGGSPQMLGRLFPVKEDPKSEKSDQTQVARRSYFYFDAPHNFEMKSLGLAGRSQRTLTAIYFDTPFFIERFRKLMQAEAEEKWREMRSKNARRQIRRSQQDQSQKTPFNKYPPLDGGYIPTIIYWKESI